MTISRFLTSATLVLGILLVLTNPALAEFRKDEVWLLPPLLADNGDAIDFMFWFIFWVTAFVFIAVQGTMLWFLWAYATRPGKKAIYSHGNNTLEIIWTTIPLIFFLALGAWGNNVWVDLQIKEVDDENAITVDIVAQQFGWNIRYAGADGKFGESSLEAMSGANVFGLKEGDPAGKDDITTYNDMVVPAGVPVKMRLRSLDVIHSVYIPEFRLYQDVVPGMVIDRSWFKAKEPANLQLACSQLCGSGHYKMYGKLTVVPKEDFDKWLAERSPVAPAETEGDSVAQNNPTQASPKL